MFRSLAEFRTLIALGLLVLAAPTHAITQFCVHDAQELADAIQAVGQGDSPVVINLRKGTYDASASSNSFYLPMVHSNQLVGISGGWSGDNGACTTHSNDPASTVIVGSGDRRPLWVNTDPTNSQFNNSVFVTDLTLRNPTGSVPYGGCMSVRVTPTSKLTVDRLVMEQCVATIGSASATVSNEGGQVDLRNIVARYGKSPSIAGMGISTSKAGETRLSQMSITANTVSLDAAPASGLSLSTLPDGSTISLSNTVVWGNTVDVDTRDIAVSGPGITLARVHYTALGGSNGAPASNVGNSSGDPGFVSPGDPRLRANSSLIDSGISSPGGGAGYYDVEGHARLTGATLDVGAFEWSDKIFASGFQQ